MHRRQFLTVLPAVALTPAIVQAGVIPEVDALSMFEHRHSKGVEDSVFYRPEGTITYQVYLGADTLSVCCIEGRAQRMPHTRVDLCRWDIEDALVLHRLMRSLTGGGSTFPKPRTFSDKTPDRCYRVEATPFAPETLIYSQGPIGYCLTDDRGRKGAILFTHMISRIERLAPDFPHITEAKINALKRELAGRPILALTVGDPVVSHIARIYGVPVKENLAGPHCRIPFNGRSESGDGYVNVVGSIRYDDDTFNAYGLHLPHWNQDFRWDGLKA